MSGIVQDFYIKVYLHNDVLLQLVSNALQFLATVADRAQYRHLFEDPATLGNICEKVIIPNMEFRGNYTSVNMMNLHTKFLKFCRIRQ